MPHGTRKPSLSKRSPRPPDGKGISRTKDPGKGKGYRPREGGKLKSAGPRACPKLYLPLTVSVKHMRPAKVPLRRTKAWCRLGTGDQHRGGDEACAVFNTRPGAKLPHSARRGGAGAVVCGDNRGSPHSLAVVFARVVCWQLKPEGAAGRQSRMTMLRVIKILLYSGLVPFFVGGRILRWPRRCVETQPGTCNAESSSSPGTGPEARDRVVGDVVRHTMSSPAPHRFFSATPQGPPCRHGPGPRVMRTRRPER